MLNFEDVMAFLGLLGQIFGLILFGIISGWFTLSAFRQPERHWQLQSVVFAVFFTFVALIARFTSPGSFGGFLLGATGAFAYWGIFEKGAEEEED